MLIIQRRRCESRTSSGSLDGSQLNIAEDLVYSIGVILQVRYDVYIVFW